MTMHGKGGPGTVWALGMAYTDLDLPGALRLLAERPDGAPFAYVCTPNAVHVVNYDRAEPRYRAGIDGAWLRLCDSQVLARLMGALFGVRLGLALGSDLTRDLLDGVVRPDDPITVIGGTADLAARLHAKYGLRRLALHEPPFGFAADPAALQACVAFVQAHPARFVFLACGAPQSEVLGLAILQAGDAVGTGLCIGASLQFVTGLSTRAPDWWQRAGLEWLHRLVQEPRRMGPRLMQGQLPVLALAARYRAGSRLSRTQGRPDGTASGPP